MIRELLATQASGGHVLMFAAAAAMFAANSALSAQYVHLLHIALGPMSLLHWINDGLMALFFCLVGCEIKRELVDGEMASWPRRLLPGVAAVAGMAGPALVYVLLNAGTPANLAGWAVPTATDIAFALGVLALLGPQVPASIKLLLTAIAVIDDLGAILVIALAYTNGLNLAALAAAGGITLMLFALGRRQVVAVWPYLLLGAALWQALHLSGIHATLAGVITALCMPITNSATGADGPLLKVEHALAPVVGFVIMPVFGFANAGVDLRGLSLAQALDPLVLGIALGLILGKQLGVFAAIMGLVRLGWVNLPSGAGVRHIWGLSVLCGIGFTMSLFIAALAFGEGAAQEQAAKLGIISGSLLSALLGMAILRGAQRMEGQP